MSCVTESSELQSALPMERWPKSGQKLNVVFMCVVPLTVAILRWNLVSSSVWKRIDFSNTLHDLDRKYYYI